MSTHPPIATTTTTIHSLGFVWFAPKTVLLFIFYFFAHVQPSKQSHVSTHHNMMFFPTNVIHPVPYWAFDLIFLTSFDVQKCSIVRAEFDSQNNRTSAWSCAELNILCCTHKALELLIGCSRLGFFREKRRTRSHSPCITHCDFLHYYGTPSSFHWGLFWSGSWF